MSMKTIPADRAKKLVESGALLVDIREADEFRREHIAGARAMPLSALRPVEAGANQVIIFSCRSGGRTTANQERLAQAASGREAYLLEGGLDAWKQAGLAVVADKRQPIELMRQVQITAGSLVVIGALLGALVHPAFYALSGFVGAGLVFAGVSGTCAMARLLRLAPWNRSPAAMTG